MIKHSPHVYRQGKVNLVARKGTNSCHLLTIISQISGLETKTLFWAVFPRRPLCADHSTVVFYAVAVLLTQTPINILYREFRGNIMGMLIESAKIVSVIVFYVRYSTEEKKSQLQFAKP